MVSWSYVSRCLLVNIKVRTHRPRDESHEVTNIYSKMYLAELRERPPKQLDPT